MSFLKLSRISQESRCHFWNCKEFLDCWNSLYKQVEIETLDRDSWSRLLIKTLDRDLVETNQYPHDLKDISLFTKYLWSRIISWSPSTNLVFRWLEMVGWDQHGHHEQFRNNYAKTQRSRIVTDSSGIIFQKLNTAILNSSGIIMQRLKEAGLFRIVPE
jgi:hypothetical protein